MPLQFLEIKADLEGISAMSLQSSCCLRLTVENDASESKDITLSPSDEEQELEGSRGTAHFVMKWNKSDRNQAYIKVLPGKEIKDSVYRDSDSGNFKAILAMECRGLKVTKFHSGEGDFVLTSEGGTNFESANFGDDDFCDYDEENDVSVMVSSFESRISDA
jgi:hypothetical protein